MKDQAIRISKFLSLVLRHKPQTIGLNLDPEGWVDTTELLEKMNAAGKDIDRELLDHVVATNNKKRFAFDASGTRIRASQGHSIPIELGYTPVAPPAILYHGTAHRFVASIQQAGLERRQRHHVHLSADRATAIDVGGRHGKPVVYEVLAGDMHAAGHSFFQSENGVWLTGQVPPAFLRLPEDQFPA